MNTIDIAAPVTRWGGERRPHAWRYSADETVRPWIVSVPGFDAADFDTWQEAFDHALELLAEALADGTETVAARFENTTTNQERD